MSDLDWQPENLLEAIGRDKDLFITILKTYVIDTPKLLSDLKSNVDAKDFQTAIRNAHSIKGASGSIGAMQVFHLASDIEHELTSNSGSIDTKNLTALEQTINSLLSEINAYVQN